MAKTNNKSRKVVPGEVIKLGMRVKDPITDTVGFVMYRLRFLQGCDHIGIAIPGVTEDGKMKELYQADVLNFEIMEDQAGAFDPPAEIKQTFFVGDFVKDRITEREGTVMAYQISLFDGPGLHIQPKGADKDGKPKNQFALEPGRAAMITKGPKHGIEIPFSEFVPLINPPATRTPGGPAMSRPKKYQ